MFGTRIIVDSNKIEETLTRRIEAVFPSREEAEKRLKEGKKLKIYLGIDPTGPDLHLGHTIPLLFLKQLLVLGHQPILLIGDFTARIGDPTEKDVARKSLTEKEVENNMKNYLGQVYKVLPRGSFEIKYNSSWLSKMSFQKIVELASHVTVQQMIQREMFQKRLWRWRCPECKEISQSPIQFGTQRAYDTSRIESNTITCVNCKKEVPYEKKDIFSEPIFVNEFLYPLMQGYDSVAMKVDGEVGGNDQTFNMLVGRDLEKKLLNKDKLVFATRLLIDSESGKKMSKTEGGLISLSDSPKDMFGKTMKTVPDEMTSLVFRLCTEKPLDWIEEKSKGDPYVFKKELAHELVRMYYGDKEAARAREEWERVFSKGELPSEIQKVENKGDIISTAVGAGIISSNSEAKRLIEQKAIKINDKVVEEWNHKTESGDVIQVGPKKFIEVK